MKPCDLCGAQFTPKRREQRFCGATCSARWVADHRRPRSVSVKHSDETREKLRQASLGRPVSEETRRKLSALRKGKPKPPEWRASIAAALTDNPNVNNRGERNPNFKHGRYVGERSHLALVDRTSCAECGRADVGLDVHHADGDHANNDPRNLIVLCDSCHGKKHGRPPRRGRRA